MREPSDNLGFLISLLVFLFGGGVVWKYEKDIKRALTRFWSYLRSLWGLASASPHRGGIYRNILAEVLARKYKNEGFELLKVNDYDIPLIIKKNEGWVPNEPLNISDVELKWVGEAPSLTWRWEGLAEKLRKKCNVVIENNPIYRLIETNVKSNGTISFTFGLGYYEDYVETCEALLWELALAVRPSIIYRLRRTVVPRVPRDPEKHYDKIREYYEKAVGKAYSRKKLKTRENCKEVLDFKNRGAAVGINTLTVITSNPKSNYEPIFLVHHREERVAEAARTLHVIPAGTFQPFHKSDTHHNTEFSIKWTIMREFGEEILNKESIIRSEWGYLNPEGPFLEDEELKKLYFLFQDKDAVKVYFMGVGLDCLTLKPEILTLLLVEYRKLIEAIPRFQSRLEGNWEGKNINNITFNTKQLKQMMLDKRMLPAGKGCFGLALKHFDWIQNLSSDRTG